MEILHTDQIIKVQRDTTPDYNSQNPLIKILDLIEAFKLCAEREFYLPDTLQWLFPISKLELYGPSGSDENNLDPKTQDSKTDFQKQNVRRFDNSDTVIIRGMARAGDWTGPFLHISYRGDTDSRLAEAANFNLPEQIKLWLKIGSNISPQLITVPYNPENNRFEVELWGYPGNDFANQLAADPKARRAFTDGLILARPDLIKGTADDFAQGNVGNQPIATVFPDHALHPILPLHLEIAWTTENQNVWDSNGGANYHYEFNMIVRGFGNYIARGMSENPHGGLGLLEYRNLLSNYGRFSGSGDLGRTLEEWNFDAFGKKSSGGKREDFMAVDYMDLHVITAKAGIGLHRHRDNSEIFLMMDGEAYMIVGDWCKLPQRERCLEVRKLKAGHFAMLKGGNLHGLINHLDLELSLFMFGGYD